MIPTPTCLRRERPMHQRAGRCDSAGYNGRPLQTAVIEMAAVPACPQCSLENTYADGALFVCADCGHEWAAGDAPAAATVVRDCNGNVLSAGDTVTVIKDLKVKGSSIPLKQGTVIRSIRLIEDDPEHIEGHSDKIKGLVLKTIYLRRA